MNQDIDTKTPEMVERLRGFWAALDALDKQNDPELPVGHWPPNLLFDFEQPVESINPSIASQEPSPHFGSGSSLDPHYLALDGQEPPQEAQDGFRAGLVELWHSKAFAVVLAVIVWIEVGILVFGR